MLKLLAFIPEPWASLVLAGLIGSAWLYGDITGRGTERQKNQIEQLTNEKNTLIEQRDAASEVQRQMARNVAAARDAQDQVEGRASDLERQLRAEQGKAKAKPRSGPFIINEPGRLRLERVWPLEAKPAGSR